MKKILLHTTKYLFAMLLGVMLLSSCLDKEPGSAIPQEEAMLSFSDAEQTMIGIYAQMKSSALWSGLLTLLPDIQTDLVYAVDGYTNTYGTIWQWDIRPTNSEIEAVYASLYSVISNCNFYLERVDGVRNGLTDDEAIAALDIYTGEVFAIRAFCYSELLKLYCKAYDPATAQDELGVVLRSQFSTEQAITRSSLYESYRFVLSDLERAEELLDEENDMPGSPYMTLAMAYALHARVALYMQDWEAAADYSSRLIDSGTFSLMSTKSATYSQYSDYDYMWLYDNGTEIIWRQGFTTTSYGGALGQVFLNYNIDYTYFYPDYVPAEWVLNLYDQNDLRYSSFFFEGQTGYDHGLAWPLLVKYYGNDTFIQSALIYHVSMPKPFRLAEQYLIRAEAYCRMATPNYAQAAKDLTTLRSARYLSGGNINLTADNWLDQIAAERVRELYMEGFRLHDYKRWGKLYKDGEGFTRTPQLNTLAEGSSLSIKGDNPLFVWPIPQHEIESPGSMIQPNESNK